MPVPLPNSQEAVDLLNDLWMVGGHYFAEDDFQVRRLKRMADALFKSDPAAAWATLAGAAGLTGDAEAVRAAGDKAIRLRYVPAITDAKATPLSNLGYFSEAQALTKHWLSVDTIVWPHAAEKAIACASIVYLADTIRQAGSMPTGIPNSVLATIELAAGILDEHGISDAMLAGWLDVAGEMMRNRRMFFLGFPQLFATRDDGFAQVDISFELDLDAEAVTLLTVELVDTCIQRQIAPPNCFSFGFRSRRLAHEHLAA